MCERCELCHTCQTVCMPSDGSRDAEIAIIGEAPGADEDVNGRPFVGKAGEILWEAMGAVHIRREDCFVQNVVRCRPPKNRNPKMKEIKACLPYLYEELEGMPNLKLLVLIGNIALKAILGTQGITKLSGQELLWQIGGKDVKVMPLIHPAFVLRNQATETKNFFDHVARIPNILHGGLVDDADYGNYVVLQTIDEFKAAVEEIANKKFVTFDLETTGFNPHMPDARVRCMSFSVEPRHAYVLALQPEELGLAKEDVLPGLKYIFESKRIRKVAQNAKFDMLWLKQMGIDPAGLYWDTQVAEYLLPGTTSVALKDMAWKYTKMGGYEKKFLHDSVILESGMPLYNYNGADSDVSNRIFRQQVDQLALDKPMMHLYKSLLIPVSESLMRMEYHGIRVNKFKVEEAKALIDSNLEQLVKDMRHQKSVQKFELKTKEEFNPNSHVQLREVLFDIEGIEPQKRTEKTGQPSTDQKVLELYKDESPLCDLLLQYSQTNTMRKTFIKELLEYTTPQNRVHTTFWLTSTSTGRTSSRNPNMQNIPKGDKDAYHIRRAFTADPGYVLVEFDFNQHELRCMAEVAKDEVLRQELDGDVHIATAADILGKARSEVTKEERRRVGKTFNFGIIYGMTVYGLAKRLGVDEGTAKLYLDRYFFKYQGVRAYMDRIIEFVRKEGYVYTLSGRRRWFHGWEGVDEHNLREAINAPIQGLAGDILLYAVLGVDKLLRGRKSFLTLEVHDSIVVNVHRSELNLIPEIEDTMLHYFREFIPGFKSELKVDYSIGLSWGEMEEVKR